MIHSRALALIMTALALLGTACAEIGTDEAVSSGLRITDGGLLSHPSLDEFCISLTKTPDAKNILYYAAERPGYRLMLRTVQTASGSDVYARPQVVPNLQTTTQAGWPSRRLHALTAAGSGTNSSSTRPLSDCISTATATPARPRSSPTGNRSRVPGPWPSSSPRPSVARS